MDRAKVIRYGLLLAAALVWLVVALTNPPTTSASTGAVEPMPTGTEVDPCWC